MRSLVLYEHEVDNAEDLNAAGTERGLGMPINTVLMDQVPIES